MKPETYKLLKFKDEVLSLMQDGTLEHTIMAFWEYVLYLEICYKVLEKDEKPHLNNHKLTEPYKRLRDLYQVDGYVSSGDFSERMSVLLQDIQNDFKAFFNKEQGTKLSRNQITELVYKHQLKDLRDNLVSYLKFKEEVVVLIDNLDKGWNTLGVQEEDLIILRTLLEASRKIENHLDGNGISCNTLIFLRNDIYELLISALSDRGKEAKVLLDWTNVGALKELIRRRLIKNTEDKSLTIEEVWLQVAASHVKGEDSLQYLIDRSLMRPRVLIDLIKACRANAIDRGEVKITEEDFISGTKTYSYTLLEEISLEIRDVYPDAKDLLYGFISGKVTMVKDDVYTIFLEYNLQEVEWSHVLKILLWYGFLGLYKENGDTSYIYDFAYDMKSLEARIKDDKVILYINPAFWGALETQI